MGRGSQPADAMKKLVWSETVVDGGAPVELDLPALPDVAGPYQHSAAAGVPTPSAVDRYAPIGGCVAVPADAAVRRPCAVEPGRITLPVIPTGSPTAYRRGAVR